MIFLLEISRTHLFLCYLYNIMAWKLKTRHCSQTQQILSNHTLQIVVSPRSNKMDVWDWVAARGFYSVSHCLRSRVAPLPQWEDHLSERYFVLLKFWGFPWIWPLHRCRHPTGLTLVNEDWCYHLIGWERHRQAGESTSERELRMCEDQSEDRKDTLRAFLFFLDSKYGNVTVASRLVSVRILTWGDPIVQSHVRNVDALWFDDFTKPKIHHLPTHNDSGLKWAHWTWTWTSELERDYIFEEFVPWLNQASAKNSQECVRQGGDTELRSPLISVYQVISAGWSLVC